MREPHQLKRATPKSHRPPSDLLQGNDVGLSRCYRDGLLGQSLAPTGDIPCDKANHAEPH
jgi:hypothetical protein